MFFCFHLQRFSRCELFLCSWGVDRTLTPLEGFNIFIWNQNQKLRIKIWILCGRASVNFSCFWIRLSFELSIFFCSGNNTVFAFAKKLLDFLIFTFLSVVDCCFGVSRARGAGNNCDNFSAHALGLRELWVVFNTNFLHLLIHDVISLLILSNIFSHAM